MNDETPQDTVASLMIPLERYPHLRAEAPLREAIRLIYQGLAKPELSGFRRALVLGKDNVLVGIINMPVLLRGLEPELLRTEPGGAFKGYASRPGPESGMAVQVFWERVFTQGFGPEPERPVGEVAKPISVTVAPGDKLARALHLMLTEKLLVLPVIKDNRVLGVVRLIEIFGRVVASLEKDKKP
jgi:CBS domain-containing protein